jgi:uncharacterized protein YijF (DUF1287 family)
MGKAGSWKGTLALLAVALLIARAASAGNDDIVTAARAQIGVTVLYDPAYRRLAFPGGDVPRERGVCTDVVVRALRAARGIDLQQRLNDELLAHWDAYPHPRAWNLRRPDPNIDHRRVPNLMKYFERAGAARGHTMRAADYLPGDIVAWDLGGGVLHIGIVADRLSGEGVPLVVHNIGSGTREEDILLRYTVIGHYRLPPAVPSADHATGRDVATR